MGGYHFTARWRPYLFPRLTLPLAPSSRDAPCLSTPRVSRVFTVFSGTPSGIRTHTAMILSHLPPSVGLSEQIKSEKFPSRNTVSINESHLTADVVIINGCIYVICIQPFIYLFGVRPITRCWTLFGIDYGNCIAFPIIQ